MYIKIENIKKQISKYYNLNIGENIIGKSLYQSDIILQEKEFLNLHFKIYLSEINEIEIEPLCKNNDLKINNRDLIYPKIYFIEISTIIIYKFYKIYFCENDYSETLSEEESEEDIIKNYFSKKLITFTGFEKNEEFNIINNELNNLKELVKIENNFNEFLDNNDFLKEDKILICNKFSKNSKTINCICKGIKILNKNVINKIIKNNDFNFEKNDFINDDIYKLIIKRNLDNFGFLKNFNVYIYDKIKPQYEDYERIAKSLDCENIIKFSNIKKIDLNNNKKYLIIIDKKNKNTKNFENCITKDKFLLKILE